MSHARLNNSTLASVDFANLFATGTFKNLNVWKGVYTEGARTGQLCVAKGFKSGSVYESHYFEQELNIIRLTQTIIDAWHAEHIMDGEIRLNTPEIWTRILTGVKLLCEPMIENYEKFNSNSGWADKSGGAWSEAMQALSHFSFHKSNGSYLLCDLQGGVYSDG
jgi:hypothetical protein